MSHAYCVPKSNDTSVSNLTASNLTMSNLTELTAALMGTTQALIAANERISVLEKTLSVTETALVAAQTALAHEALRSDAARKELSLVTHKHTAYLRHFGSCEQHPDT
jgi:conjugal transfer/entry exclusion protein